MSTITEQFANLESVIAGINTQLEASANSYEKMQQQAQAIVELAREQATAIKSTTSALAEMAQQAEKSAEAVTNASKAVEAGAQGFAGGSGGTAARTPKNNPTQGYSSNIAEIVNDAIKNANTGDSEQIKQALNDLTDAAKGFQARLDLTNSAIPAAQKKYDDLQNKMTALWSEYLRLSEDPKTFRGPKSEEVYEEYRRLQTLILQPQRELSVLTGQKNTYTYELEVLSKTTEQIEKQAPDRRNKENADKEKEAASARKEILARQELLDKEAAIHQQKNVDDQTARNEDQALNARKIKEEELAQQKLLQDKYDQEQLLIKQWREAQIEIAQAQNDFAVMYSEALYKKEREIRADGKITSDEVAQYEAIKAKANKDKNDLLDLQTKTQTMKTYNININGSTIRTIDDPADIISLIEQLSKARRAAL